MSGGRSFRSVFMVASCAGAALGCYLVSLRVASERAALEEVETKIVLAQRDLRVLQTEIGTRGRLAQLERWNAKVLALSAPSADQFLGGSFELARLTTPQHQVDLQAPVVLASAPALKRDGLNATVGGDHVAAPAARDLMREASLSTGTREVPAKTAPAVTQPAAPKSADRPVTAAKPVKDRSADKPGLAAAKPADKKIAKKPVDKPDVASAKPMTKATRIAKADPLAPLPAKAAGKTSKDSSRTQ
jgi:hypothetical protein